MGPIGRYRQHLRADLLTLAISAAEFHVVAAPINCRTQARSSPKDGTFDRRGRGRSTGLWVADSMAAHYAIAAPTNPFAIRLIVSASRASAPAAVVLLDDVVARTEMRGYRIRRRTVFGAPQHRRQQLTRCDLASALTGPSACFPRMQSVGDRHANWLAHTRKSLIDRGLPAACHARIRAYDA